MLRLGRANKLPLIDLTSAVNMKDKRSNHICEALNSITYQMLQNSFIKIDIMKSPEPQDYNNGIKVNDIAKLFQQVGTLELYFIEEDSILNPIDVNASEMYLSMTEEEK